MKNALCFLISLCFVGFDLGAQMVLPNAHAHNDYEHERPLLDALDQGFTSVEADVWLIDGQLYVYHDRPATPDPDRTLENLYLAPLLERVESHQGQVYPGYDQLFYLMVDFKNRGLDTYLTMVPLLEKYESILSKSNEKPSTRPVKFFISGDRPVEQILRQGSPLVSLDGRSKDLGRDIPKEMMPVVSESLRRYTQWSGEGEIPPYDLKILGLFIKLVHDEGKKVRLWANPDHPSGWETLIELGVDLINTDKLSEFSEFMKTRAK